MEKRKFSREEKLKILKEASQYGVQKTLDKYGLYSSIYYGWRKKLSEEGEANFGKKVAKAQRQEMKKLKSENQKLKELVAEKELEIRMLRELREKP